MHLHPDGVEGASKLVIEDDQPLVAIPLVDDGEDGTLYFAETAVNPRDVTEAALAVIGAWSDLDWDEVVESLDRIRHESSPTPPINDL